MNNNTFMSKLEAQNRIKELRAELETRHKTGLVKMASADGKPVSVKPR